MSESLISIIVPVYKVEQYLDKCISSILNQTYTNLEIILVDDGSPDNCPKKCDEWAKIDKRIKVIHKENGGLSSARNSGLDIAKGELIGFVDSDDFIESDMYEKMAKALHNNDADMCICSLRKVNENGDLIFDEAPISIQNQILTKEEAFPLIEKWYFVTAWNKLYKNHIFNFYRFPEGKIHEDEFTIHYFINECKKIVTITDELYFYMQRSTSIMGKGLNIKHLDAIDAYIERYKFFKKSKNRTLAINTLRRSCGLYIHFTKIFPYKTSKKQMKKFFWSIFARLILNFDLRSIKLLLIQIKYSLEK